MEPKIKAWIVFPGGTKFGAGRARLLHLIEEEGSLNRAVKRMGMSYRAAWGYLQELEDAAGFAFIETSGGGSRLTERASAFLVAFERYRECLHGAATTSFDETFAEVLALADPEPDPEPEPGSGVDELDR